MQTQSPQADSVDVETGPDLSSPEAAAIIAEQNDRFRKAATQFEAAKDVSKGKIVMTRGVADQSPDFQLELMRKLVTFDAFDKDCDPYDWHEMGVLDVAGETVWFKIDLYDADYGYGAEDPTDPDKTRRVLTLLFPSEY